MAEINSGLKWLENKEADPWMMAGEEKVIMDKLEYGFSMVARGPLNFCMELEYLTALRVPISKSLLTGIFWPSWH